MPQNIINELEQNLYSGKLAYGKNAKKFEQDIGGFIDNDKFIATTTYNHALMIVLSTLGLKEGDEIIASPISCLASNQPFSIKGLKINWVDIDPSSGFLCVEDLKKKLSKSTKAVFVNYYCGYIGDAEEVFKIVKEYDIPLIDDAIEAFGTEYNNLMAGNLYADATVFSFQTIRLPNTIDGGGISFKSKELYEKAVLIRDYGIERKRFRDENSEISKDCDIKWEGYGALISEFNAIIGNKQIPQLENLLNKQRENANTWHKKIEDINNISSLSINSKTFPNYWVYGVLSKNKHDTILKFREKGFYATSVHTNNNIYSVFKNKKELKGVNDFMNGFIALPSGWWVDKEDILLLEW